MINKNYYEFVFGTDLGKTLTLKIGNAKLTSDLDDFRDDMDWMIEHQIFATTAGEATARRVVRYIQPQVIDIQV